MEYDSVLDQQSISGKNVSLTVCVEALLPSSIIESNNIDSFSAELQTLYGTQ